MDNKTFLQNKYNNFTDYMMSSITNELDKIIINGEYTDRFNKRIKSVISDLKNNNQEVAENIVIFDTEGKIGIINEELIGNFIGFKYKFYMESNYKAQIDKIVQLVEANKKAKLLQFINVSFSIIYGCIKEIYTNVTISTELIEKYMSKYKLKNVSDNETPYAVIAISIIRDLLIYFDEELEDINITIKKVEE